MMTRAFAPHCRHDRHGKALFDGWGGGPTVLLYGQTWPGLSIIHPCGVYLSQGEGKQLVIQGIGTDATSRHRRSPDDSILSMTVV